MSVIHKLLTKDKLDIDRLLFCLNTAMPGVIKHQTRGVDVHYFWVDKKSTRGVDITMEDYGIELRNTGMSNKADYELTNQLAACLLKVVKGKFINEDKQAVTGDVLYSAAEIQKEIESSSNTVFIISAEHDISIYGPVRKTHFSNRLHNELKKFSGDKAMLAGKMEEIILNVQYSFENFSYGTIMQVGNDDPPMIFKLLTNEVDCMIDKYDRILINVVNEESPLLITNAVLNTILPPQWVLLDEYTIAAPILPTNEWNTLIENARRHDTFHEFVK